jgi:hypothetical protein
VTAWYLAIAKQFLAVHYKLMVHFLSWTWHPSCAVPKPESFSLASAS